MADRRRGAGGSLHGHRHGVGGRACLYEAALRQAIAAQHGLPDGDGLELRACEGCGRPFLLRGVRQPFREEGEVTCPRCGLLAASWSGTHGYVAYWYRELAMRPEA